MTQPQPTVNVPVVGTVQRRWVIVGVAVVAGIVGFAYWSRSRSGPGGGVLYDPTTGSVVGPPGYVNPVPDGPESDPVVVDDSVIRTPDQWAAVATQRLIDTGWEAQFAATAIGKYLAGDGLAPEEIRAVRAAQALAGLCPGNPPIIPLPNVINPPTPPSEVEPNPGYATDTHTQARKGEKLTDFLNRYYDGSESLWLALNPDTPTTANLTAIPPGVRVFIETMTYRLPGYVLTGNQLP